MSKQIRLAVAAFPGSSADEAVAALLAFPNLSLEIVTNDSPDLEGFDAVLIPPGASYGDYLRPGAIAARDRLASAIAAFAREGGYVLGTGNGFQILTELGLLPGVLRENPDGRFLSTDADVEVVAPVEGLDAGTLLRLPLASRYGSYWCNQASLHRMEDDIRVLLKYTDNPNGSTGDVAAVANWEGNVVGMMAQPTRAVDPALGNTDGIEVLNAFLGTCKPGFKLDVTSEESGK